MKLIVISIAWLTGILAGPLLSPTPIYLLIGFLPLLFISIKRKYWCTCILSSAALLAFIGGILFSQTDFSPPQHSTALYNGNYAEIKGTITEQPEISDQTTRIRLEVEEVVIDHAAAEVNGTILVYLPHYSEYNYLDILHLNGKLQTPPVFEDFDYQAYLAEQQIYSIVYYPEIISREQHEGFDSTCTT